MEQQSLANVRSLARLPDFNAYEKLIARLGDLSEKWSDMDLSVAERAALESEKAILLEELELRAASRDSAGTPGQAGPEVNG